MSKCIKTGARIYLNELGATVACDIHMQMVGSTDVIIIRYNPDSVVHSMKATSADARLTIGKNYINDLGFIICGLGDFDRDIREFCFF